jgi:two-component system response regulator PhoP
MGSKQIRIAILEDNDDLREELQFFLQAQGYSVWGVDRAEAFWKQLHVMPVDVVLIDIGLPGEDGFSVVNFLHQLRRHGVIIISARGSQQDHARGLSLGADFYLVKPINFANLNEAVVALWRRLQQEARNAVATTDSDSEWVQSNRQLVSPEGERLPLTPQEELLVAFLLQHRNSVCSKVQLHDQLFGYHSEPDTHRVDVIVSRLRNKARQHKYPLPIRSLFGKGLTFIDKKDGF